MTKKPKLGSGARFKVLETKLEGQGKSPESAKKIAAAIGAKKFGSKKMHKMAATGRNRGK